ncbi:DUF6545 domain-containing protein [Nocardia gipuzkoensis]
MTSTPLAVFAVTMIFVGLVAIGRWWLVNDAVVDQLINRALRWDVAAVLIGYAVASVGGDAALGQQLFMGIGVFSLAYSYGVARLLDGADPETVGARQRRYNAFAVMFALVTWACALSERFSPDLRAALDWEGLLWSVSCLFTALIGVLLARACVRELRLGAPSLRERLTYSALLVFGLYCLVSTAGGVVQVAGGAVPGAPGLGWAVASIVAFGILAALVSIPLAEALVMRAGLDRDARYCRRLRPLWRDLTTAVPEVVLRQYHFESASQLYRMTVEIWDALLHLKPYTPDAEEFGSSGMSGDEVRAFAFRAAWAVRAKRHGSAPAPNVSTRGDARAERRDRAAELEFLIRLAREWPKAVAMVGYEPDTAQAAATAAVSQ